MFNCRFEDYKSSDTTLHIHLFRNFLLEITLIGTILVAIVQNADSTECWETRLGQEIYRISVVDFVFNCVGVPFYYATRYLMKRSYSRKFDLPPFDISHACLTLIFNQILVWLGMVYVPILSIIVVIKMTITFYIKVSLNLIYFN